MLNTRKQFPGLSLFAAAITTITGIFAANCQTLVHRYSFNDSTNNTTFSDSVGGASWNGTLVGSAVLDGSQMQLDGVGGFATLPPNILSNYTQVSVEFWATLDANNVFWTRVFSFGDQNGNAKNTGLDYCHFAGGDYQNLDYRSTNAGVYVNNQGGLNGQTNVHVTVIVDPVGNHLFYYNGTANPSSGINGNGGIAPPLSGVINTLSLLGKSLYDVDPLLQGSIDEFRVYQGVMTPQMVALNDASGPNNIVNSPGTLLAVHLISPANQLVVNQNSQQKFKGDFANVSGVDLNLYGGATYTSGNNAIFTVSSGGLVHAISPGTTTLVATFGSLSATNTLTVASIPAVLTHRYSFTSDATDSVGGANGTLMGTAAVSGGKVVLDGTAGTYVDLPGDKINIATNQSITLDFWADFGDAPAWSRLFDFGADGGSTEIYLAPKGPGNGGEHRPISENFAGGKTIDWKGAWTNLTAHVTVVLDPVPGTMAIYRDGVLEFARYDATASLSLISTNLAVLGRSLVGADPYFPGAIDEFRIYSGALSPQEVALSHKNGPASTAHDPGTLNSIKVAAMTYPAYSGIIPPVVAANYANLTNFNLLPNNSASVNALVVTSSDSSIVQVLAGNMLRTLRPGSVTLSATYLGKSDSATVTVQNVGTLAHRYSFASDVSDSVGGANGNLLGTATVSGGQLVLDGTPGTYAELPPGLIEGYDAVTVDTWVTFNAAQTWARLWYFGNDRSDEFYISPSFGGGGVNHVLSTGFPFGAQTLTLSPRWENQTLHVTGVFGNGSIELYTNGVAEAKANNVTGRLSEVGNWFSWIGRSPYADPYMNMSVNEFRVYRGRLAPDEIQALDVVGPDQLLTTNANLTVSQTAGNITLSWPVAAAGFSVQSRAALGTGNWTTLTNAPTLSGSTWRVTLPEANSAQFFRLWR